LFGERDAVRDLFAAERDRLRRLLGEDGYRAARPTAPHPR
jgi:hypothetical protein